MRYICALVVLALTCACGGGGGGGGGGNPPPTGFEQIAQNFVEDCGQDTVDELIAFVDLIEPLLNPNSTRPFPNYGVLGVDDVGAAILWNLDLNGMPPTELEGIMSFLNAQDEAALPFDLNLVAGGLEPFPDQIQNIPDGIRMETPLVGFDTPLIGQGLVVSFNGGAVESIDALLQFQLTLCGAEMEITGAVVQDLVAAVPTLDVTLTLANGTTFATGTLALDGTNTAVFTLTPDGASQSYAFNLDLTTGAVTPAP